MSKKTIKVIVNGKRRTVFSIIDAKTKELLFSDIRENIKVKLKDDVSEEQVDDLLSGKVKTINKYQLSEFNYKRTYYYKKRKDEDEKRKARNPKKKPKKRRSKKISYKCKATMKRVLNPR